MKNKSSKYISCMKLNGFPILPPILTPEYRSELLHYKQLAVTVERSLTREETRTSIEQSLVYNKCEKPSKDFIVNRVPYSNLTCDIQVSQYTNNEFQVLYDDQKSLIFEIEDCSMDNPISKLSQGQLNAEELIGSNLRRNSYTLDNPSPFLIKKLADIDINTDVTDDIYSVHNKQLSFLNDDEIKQSDMMETHINVTTEFSFVENFASIKRIGTIDYESIPNVSINNINSIETKSDIMNLSSATETELMNLSLHSSIESHIDQSNDMYHEIEPVSVNRVDLQNHELHRILTSIPKDYSEKLLSLLRDEEDHSTKRRKLWAANIIVAWSRGHLVRRLFRSTHVQRLVDTIRATLVCAVQLHGETEDRIQVADVELHRRLIQQVSAACCDFHDVFFQLSAVDQMRIISTDRITKMKQLKTEMKMSVEHPPQRTTTQGRVMALASRRKKPLDGGTTGRRLFPPLTTIIQSN